MTVPGEGVSGTRDDEPTGDNRATAAEPASENASSPAESPPDLGPIDHRRLAEVFGIDAVFPESTIDDRDPAAGDGAAHARTSWFNENRPPHHDR
jgi:hypothetical protein